MVRRAHHEMIEDGQEIHWRDIDEGISARACLTISRRTSNTTGLPLAMAYTNVEGTLLTPPCNTLHKNHAEPG